MTNLSAKCFTYLQKIMIIYMMISNRYIKQGIIDIYVDSLNKLERIY